MRTGIIFKANINLLFWKFDLLQIFLSVNVNLSNMASKRQQGPDDESGILNRHIDINTKKPSTLCRTNEQNPLGDF